MKKSSTPYQLDFEDFLKEIKKKKVDIKQRKHKIYWKKNLMRA